MPRVPLPPIGFRTAGFRLWPLDRALQSLSRAGYELVELCLEYPPLRPEGLTEAQGRYWSEQVKTAGLSVASVSYHGDREEPARRQASQLRAVSLAQTLGAAILVINAEPVTEAARWADQYDDLCHWLADELLPAAAAARLKVAVEPEPGLVIGSSAEMMKLLRDLQHPDLAVNLDLGHAWLTDPDLPAALRALGDAVVQVHWSDFSAGEHRHLVPGAGDMPLAELHRTLQSLHYRGFYVIDLSAITAAPDEYARRSLQALRQIMAATGGD